MQKPITLFIADNYFLIREGIKNSLKNVKDIIVVGETSYFSEIIPLITNQRPDMIVMEISLCDRPVKQLIGEIQSASPGTKILVISDCNCELPVISSIRAGIRGFIHKNVSKEELVRAIRSIADNGDYFSPEITNIIAKNYYSEKPPAHNLSKRELEILTYICKVKSNDEISDILFISSSTIATHKRNIMKKAGVKKTSELIIWAFDNRIVNHEK